MRKSQFLKKIVDPFVQSSYSEAFKKRLNRMKLLLSLIPIGLLFTSLTTFVLYPSSTEKRFLALAGVGIFFLLDFAIDFFFYKKYGVSVHTTGGGSCGITTHVLKAPNYIYKLKKLKIVIGLLLLVVAVLILFNYF